MVKIRLVALGRLKESYLSEAMREYQKRLSGFCRFEVVELEPERLPDDPSAKEIAAALDAEAEKILAKIPPGSAAIALCIEGKTLSSEELAAEIDRLTVGGAGTLTFLIGSSYGLAERVKSAARLRLSFSKMTFPHQLARVMLAEQLYRSFTLLNHRKYHK
ncbi:MAG: 23S rRNA (pseudouridine(1915)-N(3))-methyltransferase RlmH [Bacteroides sp.]|nr:23S rRNA (pseudouridine(1915)-N(3))-methyltransferase RlmH [Eubacterium sp.]MCM1419054.1 23S rRNA (pseudouridine(1915)-N(3))-methyltransferase RlmH [Roseburia sp.]MCM1461759.1 23S rRNA (pseudouridine(1915)-N(3))-methyltransferase RlmH [Bacteroides sp.]